MTQTPFKKFFFIKVIEHDFEADWNGLTDDQLDSMEFAIEKGESILAQNCRENYGGVLMHAECVVPMFFETRDAAQFEIEELQLDSFSYCEQLPIFASVEVVELDENVEPDLREWLLAQVEYMRSKGHNI